MKLNIKSMLENGYLSRDMSDAPLADFARMRCRKAESAGCRAVGADPEGAPERCGNCGNEKKMPRQKERITATGAPFQQTGI